MVQNNYELKQSTILEMENQVLREQITDLKADIKKLEIEAQNKALIIEKYRRLIDSIVTDLDKILKT
jgi:cell division protein FtsB